MPSAKLSPEEQAYMDAMLKKVAGRLKELRVEKGYSNYEKFAFEHDIPRSQLSRYERGEDMRLTSLLKLLKALDISLAEFFSKGF